MNLTKRGFVRIISFFVGVTLALAASLAILYGREVGERRSLEYSYLRAVEELSLNLDNIRNNLEKGMYTNSVSMLSNLSGKLTSDAATAKSALSQLPVQELNLEKTNRFLSQVGNYAKSLADRCAGGERLTEEDQSNLAALYQYSLDLSESMWTVEERIRSGEITFDRVSGASGTFDAEQPATITDGFQDFETLDNSYPTLIYDGPFSDHIMEKEPLMLKEEKEIGEEEALRRAAALTGAENLRASGEESGKMPSYVFENDDVTVAVTKAGGYFSYMISSRPVGKQAITAGEARERAEDYLEKMGIRNAEDTYYEIQGGVCIVNFAAEQNDVTLYTDLIKVGVALDDGEILSFDLRGYLTNHTIRDLPQAKISEEHAVSLVSPNLEVLGASLCVIPSSGQNELFCYEVKCVGADGQNVLVYINAVTGREEQILLLKIGAGGTLTV
ncbi:MAG: germination protein YpeB [Bacteroides sp.]|nr:germination protein YpeB [Eubacterium sp.]MCM1418689.1 germination protein YpeB [Roseburia sp.]MCM1462717.1 germination protein YpeB [Bacteroides sp.]